MSDSIWPMCLASALAEAKQRGGYVFSGGLVAKNSQERFLTLEQGCLSADLHRFWTQRYNSSKNVLAGIVNTQTTSESRIRKNANGDLSRMKKSTWKAMLCWSSTEVCFEVCYNLCRALVNVNQRPATTVFAVFIQKPRIESRREFGNSKYGAWKLKRK